MHSLTKQNTVVKNEKENTEKHDWLFTLMDDNTKHWNNRDPRSHVLTRDTNIFGDQSKDVKSKTKVRTLFTIALSLKYFWYFCAQNKHSCQSYVISEGASQVISEIYVTGEV